MLVQIILALRTQQMSQLQIGKRSKSREWIRWPAVIIAALSPWIAGSAIGDSDFLVTKTDFETAQCWIAYSVAKTAPIGLAIYLAWRSSLTSINWRRLFFYGLLLIPASILNEFIVMRLGLFIESSLLEAFNPAISMGVSIHFLDEIISDYLFFASMLLFLVIIRMVCGTSFKRQNEPENPRDRLSLRALLGITCAIAVIFVAIKLKVDWNVAIAENHGAGSTLPRILHVSNIAEPLSLGMTSSVAIYLAATTSIKHWGRLLVCLGLAGSLLFTPYIFTRTLFAWLEVGTKNRSLLPSQFQLIGAFSDLAVILACISVFRLSGLSLNRSVGHPSHAE